VEGGNDYASERQRGSRCDGRGSGPMTVEYEGGCTHESLEMREVVIVYAKR
jgi:hypothetical protein